jgi:CheY-like chemotaxis protein
VDRGSAARVALVVEDDGLIRDDIAVKIRDAGWTVLEAKKAEDAVSYAEAGQRIGVLFTDIQLAGAMSGWDLAEWLRAVQPELPVIYTSGNSADRSRSVPVSVFFTKPYRAAEVVETCRPLLFWAVPIR